MRLRRKKTKTTRRRSGEGTLIDQIKSRIIAKVADQKTEDKKYETEDEGFSSKLFATIFDQMS